MNADEALRVAARLRRDGAADDLAAVEVVLALADEVGKLRAIVARQQVRVAKCVRCGTGPLWRRPRRVNAVPTRYRYAARGLCSLCYRWAHRHGVLDDYPLGAPQQVLEPEPELEPESAPAPVVSSSWAEVLASRGRRGVA